MIEEPWLLGFVEAAADPKGVALDVGANVGDWTSLLSEHFAGVVAVEPDPRAFEELRQAAPKAAVCRHAAVTSTSGFVDLYLRPSPLQSSILTDHPIGGSDQAAAPVIKKVSAVAATLDELLVDAEREFGLPVTFIKIDVEGAEASVLAGATSDRFQGMKWLIEIHDTQVAVGRELERMGYDKLRIAPHPAPGAHPNHFWVYLEPPNATT